MFDVLNNFMRKGGASFLLGGQWGSEGKGAAAAFVATHLAKTGRKFDIVTTNAGAQAGHTSTHEGVTKVVFHLPTASLYSDSVSYLNAGSIIDPEGLKRELEENPCVLDRGFKVHSNAAIITHECREAEMRADSPQTRIASTRKGVGEALARKVLRSGMTALDYSRTNDGAWLREHIANIDLNGHMLTGRTVLVEVPQGYSLSIDGPFYPHTTSRNCTVMQAMSDAAIHPTFYWASMMVIRTFPIRVGHIVDDGKQIGNSGDHFWDQTEITWEDLGVKAEITTVTKRVRRVFTFSENQVRSAIADTRPDVIYLTFCDYLPDRALVHEMTKRLTKMSKDYGKRNQRPEVLTQWGPTTDDVRSVDD